MWVASAIVSCTEYMTTLFNQLMGRLNLLQIPPPLHQSGSSMDSADVNEGALPVTISCIISRHIHPRDMIIY